MSSNGILAQVRGCFIADGSKTLLPAEGAEDREYPVDLDAGNAGWVRIFYVSRRAKHGRHSHWYWSAVRAEVIANR